MDKIQQNGRIERTTRKCFQLYSKIVLFTRQQFITTCQSRKLTPLATTVRYQSLKT